MEFAVLENVQREKLAAALILLRRKTEQEPELAPPHLDDLSYQVEMDPEPPLLNTILHPYSEELMLRTHI
jgi:hypothetical protein